MPTTTCCPLFKRQAALSLPVPQSCQLLQGPRHHCLLDDLHTKGDCLHGTRPPACSAPVLRPGPLCRMSLWWVPGPVALVRWAKEGREKQGGIKSHKLWDLPVFTFHSLIQQSWVLSTLQTWTHTTQTNSLCSWSIPFSRHLIYFWCLLYMYISQNNFREWYYHFQPTD